MRKYSAFSSHRITNVNIRCGRIANPTKLVVIILNSQSSIPNSFEAIWRELQAVWLVSTLYVSLVNGLLTQAKRLITFARKPYLQTAGLITQVEWLLTNTKRLQNIVNSPHSQGVKLPKLQSSKAPKLQSSIRYVFCEWNIYILYIYYNIYIIYIY